MVTILNSSIPAALIPSPVQLRYIFHFRHRRLSEELALFIHWNNLGHPDRHRTLSRQGLHCCNRISVSCMGFHYCKNISRVSKKSSGATVSQPVSPCAANRSAMMSRRRSTVALISITARPRIGDTINTEVDAGISPWQQKWNRITNTSVSSATTYVDVSNRDAENDVDTSFLDGCAVLWVVP